VTEHTGDHHPAHRERDDQQRPRQLRQAQQREEPAQGRGLARVVPGHGAVHGTGGGGAAGHDTQRRGDRGGGLPPPLQDEQGGEHQQRRDQHQQVRQVLRQSRGHGSALLSIRAANPLLGDHTITRSEDFTGAADGACCAMTPDPVGTGGTMDWRIGAFANFVTMVAYFAIVAAILVPLIREKQLKANRLGAATAAIFFTCAVHHGSHTVHMLLPSLGISSASGEAMRVAFDWTAVSWDLVTAGVGIYYWTLRRTYGALMSGAKLFDDLRERQRQALEINDGIVQGLAAAKLALDLDQTAVTREALESTLHSARGLITELLGEVAERPTFEAGDLRRSRAALLRKS
jgi:hypothetical protein